MSKNETSRVSSEYSIDTVASQETKKEIEINADHKKRSKNMIYKLLFSHWMAKVAVIPSILIGTAPLFIYLVFGKIVNQITGYYEAMAKNAVDPSVLIPVDETMTIISTYSWYLAIVSVGSGLMKFFADLLWTRLGSYCSTKLRHDLFQSMMRNDVSFFDTNPIGSILTLLGEDTQHVQNSFGSIKGNQIGYVSQFLVGIILAYIYSWRMAIVATCIVPCMLLVLIIVLPSLTKNGIEKFKHVTSSITIADETLSSIRTVRGFNKESMQVKKFMKETKDAAHYEQIIGMWITVMISLLQLIFYGITVGNLYWGATMIDKNIMEAGDLFAVYGFTLFGCTGLVMLQTSANGEQKAIEAGARILKLIEVQPSIRFDGGEIIDVFKGHIQFINVSFKYPTRDVYVLKNINFEIKPGQIGALVGHSGSGKSTCVQLIERFYDIDEGLILLDGRDIKSLDPRWLHRNIALVSQEPTLFQMSIKDNIKYGKQDSTDEQIFEAARIANAANFIEKLDHKYDEIVGEKGSTLSGGQRQRIAIARAIIKDPVILITDEATSALDSQSEKKVQNALDKVMESRTAVIVAHRLSTIRNANIIFVFESGEIKEIGNHSELLELGGFYYNLVERQLTAEDAMKSKNYKLIKEEIKKSDSTDKGESLDDESN